MAINFSVSEWVEATPQRVFDMCSDFEHAGEWMNGLVRIEWLSEGGFQTGARWREVRKMYGKEATEEFELKSCDPPDSFDVYVDGSKGASKKGEYFFDHQLRAENGGTRFEINAEITGMGWIGKIIGPVVGRTFKKAMAKDLASMKAYIESKETA